jgi:hypothetical protein
VRVNLRVPTRPLLGVSLTAARANRIVQSVPEVERLYLSDAHKPEWDPAWSRPAE